MPAGASAAGEAFELLTSRYLTLCVGLEHLSAPFYTHLESGKWVQFDGLFSRQDGGTLVLEAKFYLRPVSLSTPGIAARITFVKELGVSGIVLAARSGFHRNIMRLRLPIEKVLLSWPGMRKGLDRRCRGVMTAALDRVTPVGEGFAAASGARLVTAGREQLAAGRDGIVFVRPEIERWLRRLPASNRDVDISRPPRPAGIGADLDMETAWAIEDSLRGFAPARPALLEWALEALQAGPLGLRDAWRLLWRRGYRGKKGGAANALDDLCVIGAAEKFRSARGLFYGPAPRTGRFRDSRRALCAAVGRWPAFIYFTRAAAGLPRRKSELAAHLSGNFTPLYPYARSLFNPAKVAGLLALEDYISSSTAGTNPSQTK